MIRISFAIEGVAKDSWKVAKKMINGMAREVSCSVLLYEVICTVIEYMCFNPINSDKKGAHSVVMNHEGICVGYMDVNLSKNKKLRFANVTDVIRYELEVCEKFNMLCKRIS